MELVVELPIDVLPYNVIPELPVLYDVIPTLYASIPIEVGNVDELPHDIVKLPFGAASV